MKNIIATLSLMATLILVVPAIAQKAGPNGGMMMGKDGHETELIVSPTELTVYIHEHGKPEDLKGAKFRAVIQQGGKNNTVTFVVDGKKLVAKLAAPLGKGAIVVVSGTGGDNHIISSRYVID